jgi:hypothetical protein
LEGLNFLRFHFINNLKESHSLRFGSSNDILSMQTRDEQRLIEGLRRHNYENFWEINQGLRDRSISEFKKYAIRILSNRHHTYVQANIDVQRGEEVKEGGALDEQQMQQMAQVSLGDVLLETFPRLFESQIAESGELEIAKNKQFEVIIQGVEADLNTPLYWL